METKVNNFDILKEMGERNLDIAGCVDMLNFQRDKRGGKVTVGVASPQFDHLINQAATGVQTHQAVLLIYNIEQFKALEKELNGNA